MATQQDWAAVEGHRYRAYGELVLRLCRTPVTAPAYLELQGRCRDAAERWQEAYRALHTSWRHSAERSRTDRWEVPVSLLATGDGAGPAEAEAH